MRIAATADLHFTPERYARIESQLAGVRNDADVLIIAGDLTNYGKKEEIEPLINNLLRLGIPIIVVLGNHDYESGQEEEICKLLTTAGIKVLNGTGYEQDGVGFAGTKGFIGGFGRAALTAFGEPEIKAFVKAAIDEGVKLERAMSLLRTPKRVVVLHYAPIQETVAGEFPEIYCYLGTSRLIEVVDRHGANLVLHGHAHNGAPKGRSTAGVPVHNVSLPLLQSQKPGAAYQIFDI